MSRRPARKLTAVEVLIIVAMLGIALSVVAPRRKQAPRRARTQATRTRSKEGVRNIVEQPETRKRTGSARRAGGAANSWGRTVALAVTAAVVVVLLRRVRGKRPSPRRPSRHRHPPEAEE